MLYGSRRRDCRGAFSGTRDRRRDVKLASGLMQQCHSALQCCFCVGFSCCVCCCCVVLGRFRGRTRVRSVVASASDLRRSELFLEQLDALPVTWSHRILQHRTLDRQHGAHIRPLCVSFCFCRSCRSSLFFSSNCCTISSLLSDLRTRSLYRMSSRRSSCTMRRQLHPESERRRCCAVVYCSLTA